MDAQMRGLYERLRPVFSGGEGRESIKYEV